MRHMEQRAFHPQTPSGHSLSGVEIASGPYEVPGLPEIWAVKVTDPRRAALGGWYPGGLAAAFRDVFGQGAPVDPSSWSEYLKCPLGHKVSAGEAYRVDEYRPVWVLETGNRPPVARCPTCNGMLRPFYDQDALAARLVERMLGRRFNSAALVDAAGTVYGFAYGWLESVRRIFEEVSFLFKGVPGATPDDFRRTVYTRSSGVLTADSKAFFLYRTWA